MTKARRLTTQRRTAAGAAGIPPELARWFAGEPDHGMAPLLLGNWERLAEFWAMWLVMHPGARPPTDDPMLLVRMGVKA